jgi:nucleotide-binding universal stress UspA family protein
MEQTPPSIEFYGPAASRLAFERGTDGPRVIMVGVDGSRSSERAGAFAVGMARRQGSQLVVVFVQRSSAFASMSPTVAAAARVAMDELAAELRRDVRRTADELGVPIAFVTGQGDPLTVLSETADRAKADSVVVGASMRVGHRFVGSMANRLVRLGRWPVIVVP